MTNWKTHSFILLLIFLSSHVAAQHMNAEGQIANYQMKQASGFSNNVALVFAMSQYPEDSICHSDNGYFKVDPYTPDGKYYAELIRMAANSGASLLISYQPLDSNTTCNANGGGLAPVDLRQVISIKVKT